MAYVIVSGIWMIFWQKTFSLRSERPVILRRRSGKRTRKTRDINLASHVGSLEPEWSDFQLAQNELIIIIIQTHSALSAEPVNWPWPLRAFWSRHRTAVACSDSLCVFEDHDRDKRGRKPRFSGHVNSQLFSRAVSRCMGAAMFCRGWLS